MQRMDFDRKEVLTIAASSLAVAIISYYFVAGGASLTSAIWFGFANAIIDAAAVVLVNMFYS